MTPLFANASFQRAGTYLPLPGGMRNKNNSCLIKYEKEGKQLKQKWKDIFVSDYICT